MTNILRSTTALAHYIIRSYVPKAPDDPLRRSPSALTAIDATCGGGHDTLALAQMLWPREGIAPATMGGCERAASRLLAYDIQPAAIRATRERLLENGFGSALEDGRIQLFCKSHESMSEAIAPGSADLILFNLGYLPGGDKSVTTQPKSTLAAVRQATELLAQDGLLSIVMYSGHQAGAIEKAELLRCAEALDSSLFHVAYISLPNQHRDPPELLLITRKG